MCVNEVLLLPPCLAHSDEGGKYSVSVDWSGCYAASAYLLNVLMLSAVLRSKKTCPSMELYQITAITVPAGHAPPNVWFKCIAHIVCASPFTLQFAFFHCEETFPLGYFCYYFLIISVYSLFIELYIISLYFCPFSWVIQLAFCARIFFVIIVTN